MSVHIRACVEKSFPRSHYAVIKLDYTLFEFYGNHALETTQNVIWSLALFDAKLRHILHCF